MRPGDRVAVFAANSDRYIEMVLAAVWAGGVACPFNVRWSGEDVAAALALVEPAVVAVDEPRLEGVRGLVAPASVVLLDETVPEHANHEQLIAEAVESQPVEPVGEGDDPALLLFTSGTTGFSKAAALSHTNVLSAVMAMRAVGTGSIGTYLHVAPLFHLAGVQMLLSHLVGEDGPQVVLPSFNPVEALALIERHGVTDTLLVPTMLRMLLDHPAREQHDLGSLRRIHYGGAPMPAALLDDARSVLGDVEFVQGYGMTETMLTTTLPPEAHRPGGVPQGAETIVGRPHPTVELAVRDDDGHEVGEGVVGELTVRGATVMSRYYGDDAATAATIRNGWLHTGDAGYVDADGWVHLVDRLKDLIITGGENVPSVRVEDVLTAHPEVSLAAVVGVPDSVWGERVHALVVPTAGNTPRVEDLIAFCRDRLAGFMCPRTIELRDELPVSPAGKILKTTLRAEIIAPSTRGRAAAAPFLAGRPPTSSR